MIKKKLAIVGSGISGLSAAYYLKDVFNITLYEKESRLGGHSRTININKNGNNFSVDTGFIVMNDRNYPNLTQLFDELEIKRHKTEMSFSVTGDDNKYEWSGSNLFTLFANKKNLFDLKMLKGIYDIIKFNNYATKNIANIPDISLGSLINKMNLSDWFKNYYLLPMGGAIWSCPVEQMLEFPAVSFINFFNNHGLLSINNRPTWYSLVNKSIDYVSKIEQTLVHSHKIIKDADIVNIFRENDKIHIKTKLTSNEFDYIVFACNPEEVKSLIHNIAPEDISLLEQFKREKNIVYTHSDISHMPKNKKCWSSWNYRYSSNNEGKISVTYWMNLLQQLNTKDDILVTLNPNKEIDKTKIYDIHEFYHPVFDAAWQNSVKLLQSINGKKNIYYCGAYMFNGFHEDGIKSAKIVVDLLKKNA